MHRPAAVQFRVGRSPWLAWVLLLLWSAGLVSSLIFFQTQHVSPWVVSISAFATLLVSGLALRIWFGWKDGILRWDGAAWHWSGFDGDAPCSVTLCMDFQRLMIVVARRQGIRPAWLWLSSVPGARDWLSLRRAVVMAAGRSASDTSEIDVPAHDSR